MAGTTDRLFQLLDQYYQLATNGLKRIQDANTAINANTYTFSQFMKDAVTTWTDAVAGAWLAAQPPDAGAVNLLFVLGPNDQDVLSQVVPTALSGQPACTDLKQIGGNAAIPVNKVTLVLAQGALTVGTQGLVQGGVRPAAGLYVGAIQINQKPVATIQLLVM